MSAVVLSGYFTILGILCIYGLHRFYITRKFRMGRNHLPTPGRQFAELPAVTIQLPVFNEKFVIERLIDNAVAINYPKDKIQVQVLDDSTDETSQLGAQKVAEYRAQGYDIEFIHREDRTGFKAGALEHGLQTAKGELIAIFDADFVPDPNIMMDTVHFFTDPKVGMVQTRWEHLNREHSVLTKVQAIMLDAHFVIEHGGRYLAQLFFNFNGTAGIWRRQAIQEAGGWEHDTLTEDLDLSYRAQLKGWRFVFVQNVACPSELPTEMTAFKSQQHRWAKGSVEVMLKLLPKILRSRLPWRIKLEAFFHLTGNMAYLLMVINSIFFVIPSMFLRYDQPWWRILFVDGPLFLLASVSFIHFYLTAQKTLFQTVKGKRRLIPALMAIGIGLGVNNSRAVLEALLGFKTAFVRTPKTGITNVSTRKANKRRYTLPKTGWGYFELFLGFAYSLAIGWAIALGHWGSLPFLILFQNGFYFIGWMSIREERGSPNGPSLKKGSLNPV